MTHARSTETVLLAVVGMSPAVLSETVWALAHEAEPVLPDRVIAVTTVAGRQRIADGLLTPLDSLGGVSAWQALRAALEAEGFDLTGKLRFGATGDDIRVITAADPATGETSELNDLRDAAENEAAADFLLEQVRGIVANPDTSLVASMAGGRKTMGALLYACLTLLGRETDRLTHVLVNEPYETLPGFFFPAQPGNKIKNRVGDPFEPAAARIQLADVPFVPLRNLFERDLNQPAGSFRRLIELCSTKVRETVGDRIQIELDPATPVVRANGAKLKLSAREYLVFLFFARRARADEIILANYDEAETELDEFRKECRKQASEKDWTDWRASEGLNNPLDVRELIRLLSDIRAKTRRANGDIPYLADLLPRKGRCSLDIPSENIAIK